VPQIKTKKILISSGLLLLAIIATSSVSFAGANSLAAKGNSNYKKKDYSKAYEYYKKAEEESPDNSKIKFNIGNTFYRLKDYESAEAFFKEAAKDKETRARSFYNTGNANFKNKNFKEAVKNYRQAILLKPKEENPKHNLQLTLKKIKQEKNNCNKKQKNDPKKDKKKNNNKNKQNKKPEISKEQAKRLLKMLKEKEKSSIKPETMNLRMQKKDSKKDIPQGKDW
jgi:Ca-activated chloride channel homolog